MTNDECRMTNQARMTEPENSSLCQTAFRHLNFRHSFVIRYPCFVIKILRRSCEHLLSASPLGPQLGLRSAHHPTFLITSSVSARSSNKKSGAHACNRSRDQLPVATAMVRAPNAFPQAIS